jgi:transcription elongation GreA/GreB family factor
LPALTILISVEIKHQLFQLCAEQIQQRITDAETAIAEARKASENDTKSSAGDKYETGRAMMQQEIDLNSRQLLEARKMQAQLQQINTENKHEFAQVGSLVETDQGDFYLAVSAGALFIGTKRYYAISVGSPMGLQVKGKKTGERFKLNGKEFQVLNVC